MIRRMRIAGFLCLATMAGAAAAEDLRRCQRTDGSVVYTDRQCEPGQNEQTAAPAYVPSSRPGLAAIAPPPACSGSADDLLFNVRTAIDAHDVNLLARSYHWPGLGDAQVESVLDRLDALVQKPLVDIRLLYPEPATIQAIPVTDPEGDDAGLESDPDPYARKKSAVPFALKLQQYASSDSSEILGTRFGLQRHFNCWWIRY